MPAICTQPHIIDALVAHVTLPAHDVAAFPFAALVFGSKPSGSFVSVSPFFSFHFFLSIAYTLCLYSAAIV